MKKGDILNGMFSKHKSKSWWNCEFIEFDTNGNYVVNTENGIKTFKPHQYYPNAVKSKL